MEVLHSQQPYGLASVRELLTFLISLLNLSDRHNTDTMRSMGLTIVNIALEVGGTSIKKFPSLVTLVRDDLAKHLFGIAAGRETKNPMVHTIFLPLFFPFIFVGVPFLCLTHTLLQLLSQSLRVIVTLFHLMREFLRAHLETFLTMIFRKFQEESRSVEMHSLLLEPEPHFLLQFDTSSQIDSI